MVTWVRRSAQLCQFHDASWKKECGKTKKLDPSGAYDAQDEIANAKADQLSPDGAHARGVKRRPGRLTVGFCVNEFVGHD